MKAIMKINLSVVILIIVFTLTANSQTNVSGGIYSNTTWSLSNSPYIVTDTLVVFPNVILTIEPGVIVKINDNLLIDIRGTLSAIGTSTDSITFTSLNPLPTYLTWDRILIFEGGNVFFNYCKLMYSYNGLCITNINAPFYIENCFFYHNNIAIQPWTTSLPTTTIYIDSCKFSSNIYSLIGEYFSVTNSEFNNNELCIAGGSSASNCQFCSNTKCVKLGGGNLIENCTFSNNRTSIEDGYAWYYGNVINNNFINNDTGIYVHNTNSQFYNNNFYNSIGFDVVVANSFSYNFTNNCWSTNDSLNIANRIYDGYDNILFGLVDFTPLIVCDSTVIPDLNYCNTAQVNIYNISIKSTPFLHQNYPNPFNEKTIIEFYLNKSDNVTLAIYDVNGRIIMQLLNKYLIRDKYYIQVNLINIQAGIYYYKLKTSEYIITNKMIKI